MLFSVAITVAAFVPLFTMQGVEGQIFGPMARTYGYALAGALIATFTVTPVLASLVLPEHVEEAETFIVRACTGSMSPRSTGRSPTRGRRSRRASASWRWSACSRTHLGSEFLPALEEGNFWIRASMPPTISLEDGTEATRKMRQILLRHPEVITVVSQHGRPDNGSDASPFSNVELFAPLKPFDEWPHGETKDKLTEQLQKEFAEELPGVGFNFSQYIQDNIEEAISGVKGANSVKILGPNLDTLEKLADQVKDQMAQVRGIADLGIFHVLGQPNLNIKVDREKAARYGLNTGDVNTVIQAAMGGAVATTVLEGDRQFDLVGPLRPALSRQHREDPQHQGRLPDAERDDRLHPAAASWPRSASIPAPPRSITRRPSASFRSSSACAAAISAARWRRPEAHRRQREAAHRLSPGLGRRVRRPAGSPSSAWHSSCPSAWC